MTKTTTAERTQLLEELYDLHLKALIEQMRDPKNATAATLQAVQRALSENGINHGSLTEPEREKALHSRLADELRDAPALPPMSDYEYPSVLTSSSSSNTSA